MFKNKTIKLFIILGVILFSLVGVVGCTKPTGSDNVNATYIRTSVEIGEGNNQFKVVNNHSDLVTLLENNTPEKYNEDFFKTKSLLVFEIFEESGGNRSEIESYEIIDKTINVYVETKQYGATTDIGIWCFILELSNEEVETFENVNIFKNGEEIMSDNDKELSDKAIECYFEKYIKVNRPNASIEDVWLFEYLGTYNGVFVGVFLDKKDCVFIERECEIIVEDIVFKYSYGYNIYVYDGCNFMDLLTAYNSSKLVYEDLLNIYELHNKIDN